MTPKEISRASQRIFGGLLPPNWAFRSQEDQEDYGVDGEIEVTTAGDNATGFIFKIQLKGNEQARFDSDGSLVFGSASVCKFVYYTQQLSTPLVFVVCDLSSGFCFWIKVQGNRALEADLAAAQARGQSTFTIKFPARNRWLPTEETQAAVLEAVNASHDSITIRRMGAISERAIRAEMPDVGTATVMGQRYRLLAAIATDSRIRGLLEAGDFGRASDEAERVLENDGELPAVRIAAGFNLVQAMQGIIAGDPVPTRRLRMAGFRLGVAGGMVRVARRRDCENYHRVLALGFARSSRLRVAAESAKAAVVSEMVQRESGDTSALSLVELQHLDASDRVARDFFALQRMTTRAFDRPDETLFAMPYIWGWWAEAMVPFLWALRRSGKEELAAAYLAELDRIFSGCVFVVSVIGDELEGSEAARSLALRFVSLVVPDPGPETDSRMRALREAIGERIQSDRFAGAYQSTEETMREVQESAESGQAWTVEEAKEHYEQLAYGLGMDIDDPTDQFAEAVRIGIADLDPTRVVSKCRFIHVVTTTGGVPARIIGLPTAGFKRVICLKHGHSMEGLKLDDVYEHFSKLWPWDEGGIRCENCPDCSPHEDDWKWTEEWGREQAERYALLRAKREFRTEEC